MMRLAYASIYDVGDVHQGSGTPFYMARALGGHVPWMQCIAPLETPRSYVLAAKHFFYRRLWPRPYSSYREPLVLKGFARQLEASIAREKVDFVFSPSTLPLAYLQCREPVGFWIDAVFAAMVGFYPQFSELTRGMIRMGNDAEQKALDRASLAIFSSDWAARAALEHYRVDPARVRVVPFGANVEDRSPDIVEASIASRPADRCRLLFVGVDWQRKGGDIALDVAGRLKKANLPVRLDIVGCEPEIEGSLPEYVQCHGFVSKSTAEGRKRLKNLLEESHFLLLPSRADCSPIVVSEASAFGVPCLGTRVGGIATLIKEWQNGYLFPADAGGGDYAACIMRHFENYSSYQALARSSFEEYRTRLNWGVSAARVAGMLAELV